MPYRRLPRGGVDRNTFGRVLAALDLVASRAEAWIETCSRIATISRGFVASRAEAWIETFIGAGNGFITVSPPARRRGSKLVRRHSGSADWPSPPARRRGS